MKRVCIVTTSLGKGGAERFSAILSQMLSNLGYEVHIVITKNDIDYEFAGTLFNLEQKFGSNLSNFKKLRILHNYFKKQTFDAIIDNRTRPVFFKEYIIYNYVFSTKKMISVVHNYHLESYFPNNKFLANCLYNKKSILVSVSKEIQNKICNKYGLEHGVQIYNPATAEIISEKANENRNVTGNFILWYGRIEMHVKNLPLLLEAYKRSSLPNKNVSLYIIGQGNDVALLKEKIKTLQIENYVNYIPFLKNPFPYVKKALFTTLTSRHEGFPMVLLESFICGTPVVSVDCKSGPSEIIQHEYNGLLVENHNEEALAKAFDTMVNNKLIYNTCKANSKKSVERFSIENIARQWYELLENDI